jgi:cytochrome c oxidase subunit 5b
MHNVCVGMFELKKLHFIGFPVESHDVIWINLDKSHEHDRCPECGSVYEMDFVGSEEDHHH